MQEMNVRNVIVGKLYRNNKIGSVFGSDGSNCSNLELNRTLDIRFGSKFKLDVKKI